MDFYLARVEERRRGRREGLVVLSTRLVKSYLSTKAVDTELRGSAARRVVLSFCHVDEGISVGRPVGRGG